jgi:transposase InsO family protein
VLLRDELLAREAFDTLLEAKVLIERWRQHYNTIRPHSALGYQPPARDHRRRTERTTGVDLRGGTVLLPVTVEW